MGASAGDQHFRVNSPTANEQALPAIAGTLYGDEFESGRETYIGP
jgi:hypothetical protein